VPLRAVTPLLAWSFAATPIVQVVPSQCPMSMPSAMVDNGATAVRLTCTGPVAVTVNGNAALPSWLKPPENNSVMVAAAGAVDDAALGDDEQATAPPATTTATTAARANDEKPAGDAGDDRDDRIEVVIYLVGSRESKPLASLVTITARGFTPHVTSLPHSVLQQIIANFRFETPCSHEMTHRSVLIEGNERGRWALALLLAAPDAQGHDSPRCFHVGVAGQRRLGSVSN
jgi:hypothetical protein